MTLSSKTILKCYMTHSFIMPLSSITIIFSSNIVLWSNATPLSDVTLSSKVMPLCYIIYYIMVLWSNATPLSDVTLSSKVMPLCYIIYYIMMLWSNATPLADVTLSLKVMPFCYMIYYIMIHNFETLSSCLRIITLRK